MRSSYTSSWKRSIQPRRQRKYKYTSPLHMRGKLVSCHLSKELRKKHNVRSLTVKVGDKVKVYSGQFKKKTGKVNNVDRLTQKVFVEGVDMVKKEGTRIPYGIHASNLEIIELDLTDKKRLKNKGLDKGGAAAKKSAETSSKPKIANKDNQVKEGEK